MTSIFIDAVKNLGKTKAAGVVLATFAISLAAHTGLEPVISALRGQRVNRLHQCAAEVRIIGVPTCGSQVYGSIRVTDRAPSNTDFLTRFAILHALGLPDP